MVKVNFPIIRKELALDFDEVIIPCLNHYLDFYNEKFNVNFSVGDFNSYKWWEVFNVEKKQTYEIADSYFKNIGESYEKIDLLTESFENFILGAEEGIELLSRFYNLNVITDRHPNLKSECYSYSDILWFDDNINDSYVPQVPYPKNNYDPLVLPYDKFYFTRELNKSKAQICLEKGIGTIVDDNLDIVQDCAKNGLEVLLLSKPWNIDFDENNFYSKGKVIRVNNWQEICDYLVKKYIFPIPNVNVNETRTNI